MILFYPVPYYLLVNIVLDLDSYCPEKKILLICNSLFLLQLLETLFVRKSIDHSQRIVEIGNEYRAQPQVMQARAIIQTDELNMENSRKAGLVLSVLSVGQPEAGSGRSVFGADPSRP